MTTDQHGSIHTSAGAPGGGQFAGHVRTAPGGTLTEPEERRPLTALDAAVKTFRTARETLQREAIREMRRAAPDDAELIVFEHVDETGMSFSHFQNADGEPIEGTRNETRTDMYGLIEHFDESALRDQFEHDDEMYWITATDPNAPTGADATERALHEAIERLHTAGGDPTLWSAADHAVQTAAVAHIRQLLDGFDGTLTFDWSDQGNHMTIMRAVSTSGEDIDLYHLDRADAWQDADFAASNITAPSAYLTKADDYGRQFVLHIGSAAPQGE